MIWDVSLIWDLGFDLRICIPLDLGENTGINPGN